MANIEQIYPPSRCAGKLFALIVAAGLGLGLFHFWMQSLPPVQLHFLPGYAMATLDTSINKKTVTIGKTTYLARAYTETLRARVYGGRSLPYVVIAPAIASGVILFGLLILGGMYDTRQLAKFRAGRRLRGPEMLTVRQYNKQSEGDGLAILLEK